MKHENTQRWRDGNERPAKRQKKPAWTDGSNKYILIMDFCQINIKITIQTQWQAGSISLIFIIFLRRYKMSGWIGWPLRGGMHISMMNIMGLHDVYHPINSLNKINISQWTSGAANGLCAERKFYRSTGFVSIGRSQTSGRCWRRPKTIKNRHFVHGQSCVELRL